MSDQGPGIHKIRKGLELLLEGLGADQNDPHLEFTAQRAAVAWYSELCAGMTNKPPSVTTFPSDMDHMVVLRDIPIHSICAHHLLPFVGRAVIGYVPGRRRILGVSKLARVADHFARRLQVQENLTEQIAEAIVPHVVEGEHGGVAVLIRAHHMCMSLRGVKHPGDMVTSTLRGVFRDATVRAEFMTLAFRKD